MSDEKAILLVEDEDAIRLTLRDYLLKKDFTVFVASDGVGAIKQLLDNPQIHIIVTDYRMEILGGDYWIKFLKQYCSNKEVIVTSGFLRPEFPIPYRVFYKPYDYAELEEALSQIFSDD